MYFRNTKVYFQRTRVYSRSTKVYSPSTKVYFQSTSILSNYTSILSKNKSWLWKYKSILWRKNPKTRLLRVLFDSIDLLALFGVYAGFFFCLFVCLFVCVFVCLIVWLIVCLFVRLFVYTHRHLQVPPEHQHLNTRRVSAFTDHSEYTWSIYMETRSHSAKVWSPKKITKAGKHLLLLDRSHRFDLLLWGICAHWHTKKRYS